MKRRMTWSSALLCAALVLAHVAYAAAQSSAPVRSTSRPWPHEASDLAPDPGVTYGALANGMRYVLMRNELPPGQVGMHLVFDFGGWYEADDEDGLAHFIEHMAFNGSNHLPEGEVFQLFERLGLRMGADTNASTGGKNTIYQFTFNQITDEALDQGLFFFREVASELRFDAAAIDRERGVVLSEWRANRGLSADIYQSRVNALAPDSLAAKRTVIGKREIIETAPRERLVSLYERFYRPQRATLVVVGDIDVASVEAKIASRFGDWVGKGLPGVDPDFTYTPPARSITATVLANPQLTDVLQVFAPSARRVVPDSLASRRDAFSLAIVAAALVERIDPMKNADPPPFHGIGISTGTFFEAIDVFALGASLDPGGAKAAVGAVEKEWRRALRYGLSQGEIDDVVKGQLIGLRLAAEQENARNTRGLVRGILAALLNDTVFTTPSSDLARAELLAKETTVASVHAVIQQRMAAPSPVIYVESSAPPPPGLEAELVGAWQESSKVEIAPPEAPAAVTFAYTDFGPSGKVVGDVRRAELDARLVTFENNVRLAVKKTQLTKGGVLTGVRIGHGALDLPLTPPGLGLLAQEIGAGGLERHSLEELQRIVKGTTAVPGFTTYADVFGSVYAHAPQDLLLQLQIAAAYTVAPGFRPEAERSWHRTVELAARTQNGDSTSALYTQVLPVLSSGHPGIVTANQVKERTFAEVAPLVKPMLSKGAVEITIVGDIDEQAAIDAVAKTFGALPQRSPPTIKLAHEQPVVFREDKSPLVFTHDGPPEDASAMMVWPVAVDPEAEPQAALVVRIMAAVMQSKVRDEVREALGAAYSPGARFEQTPGLSGFNYVSASANVEVANMDVVLDVMRDIAAQIRDGAFSDDELARVIKPQLAALAGRDLTNGYWGDLLSQIHSRPELTERKKLAAIEAALRAVSRADIVSAARVWLADEAAQEIRILPKTSTSDPRTDRPRQREETEPASTQSHRMLCARPSAEMFTQPAQRGGQLARAGAASERRVAP